MPNMGAPELLILLFIVGVLAFIGVGLLRRSRPTEPARNSPGTPAPPGWFTDPMKRHQFRYWDGIRWTATVSDNGAQSNDPI